MPEQLTTQDTQEVATASGKDRFFYGGRDFLLESEDPVLRVEARNRLSTYRDLERDAKVYACLQRRYEMVVNADLAVKPGPRRTFTRAIDNKMRDMVEAQINAMGVSFDVDSPWARAEFDTGFTGAQFGLLDAILMGYASAEIMWNRDGREIYVEEIRVRDQKRFKVDQDHNWRLITSEDFMVGKRLRHRKFLFYTFGSFYDPYGLGLGNRLYWPVLFKRKGIGFWIRMLDKYGAPTAVGKYPPGTPLDGDGSQQQLLDAAAAIQSDSAIVIPEGQVIELLQAIQTAAQQGYDQFERFIDGQISQAILGVTLTTDTSGNKSAGAAQVHSSTEKSVGKRDAVLLMNYLTNTLSRWITDYNAGPDVPAPRLVKTFPAFDFLREQASIDQILANQGYRRTLESVNDLYGYGEDVYVDAPPTQAPANPKREMPDEDQEDESEEGQGLVSADDNE